jgi:hypothetical protein
MIYVVMRLSTSYAEEMNVPAFNIENNIVWGATMMLSEKRSKNSF